VTAAKNGSRVPLRRSVPGLAGRRFVRLATAAVAGSALCLGLLPGAAADDDASIPTRDQVEAAQRHVDSTAEEVGRIKAELVGAEAEVRRLELEAQKAVEAYNGAVYELRESRRTERRTRRAANRATAGLEQMHDDIATAVVGESLDGGSLADLGVLVTDPDPSALMDQLSSYRGYTGALESELDEFDARSTVADVLLERAEQAVADNERAAERADTARLAAEAAVDAAEDAALGLAARQDELVRELARAEDISVELARSRHQGLLERAEERAQRQAEERAQEQAEREARQEARRERRAEERREQRAEDEAPTDGQPDDRPDDGTQAPVDDEAGEGSEDGTDAPTDEEVAERRARREQRREQRREERRERRQERREQSEERPETPGDDVPAPDGGVEAAVRFALAQVGEPYVWAAAGPDAWDCSGLTMGAWAAAGVALPHWSVAQHEATTPVSMSQLRRGDLLFWSDGSADSIYHVALYLGDGMMVHAPRTGRDVEVVSMYYWTPPDLAGRI
jgi:cell wall-associated NlpC family hydrolase